MDEAGGAEIIMNRRRRHGGAVVCQTFFDMSNKIEL